MPQAPRRPSRRQSRRRGEAAERHADSIRFVLFEARPAGLSSLQLQRATELTPSQLRSGLAKLRDIITERDWPPIIWTRADGYRFGAPSEEVEQYIRSVVKEKLREIRRLITGTVAPQITQTPAAKWVHHANTQLAAVESTLDLLVPDS